MTAISCPCCGQPVNAGRTPVTALTTAPLPYGQAAILRELVAVYPGALNSRNIINRIYTNSNRPKWAHGSVKKMVHELRKRLPEYGWTIPRGCYRLEPLP